MKKLTAKILFDTVMTVLWVILMVYALTGSFWHEVLGLVIFGLFIIHIGYNTGRMATEMPRMFSRGAGRTTFRYLLVIFLTAGVLLTGISGVLISQDILTGISTSHLAFWTPLHHWAAYITLALIGIHIGLHLKMIGGMITYALRRHPRLVKGLRRGWNGAAAVMVLCGAVASVQYDLPSFSAAGTATATSGQAGGGGEGPAQSDRSYEPVSANVSSAGARVSSAGTVQISYDTTADGDSLEDYLGSLHCTFCHRYCPLTAIQCGRGESAVEQATQEYYASQDAGQDDSAGQDDWSGQDDSAGQDDWSGQDDSAGQDDWSGQDDWEDDSADTPEQTPAPETDSPSDTPSDDPTDTPSDTPSTSSMPDDSPGVGDIMAIMGLYIGGTHYVTRIADRRRKRS